MAKAKKMTFRQRLRKDAEEALVAIIGTTTTRIRLVADDHGLKVGELAKVCSPGEHKTLFESMVTQLANRKEAELEKLYNNQTDMLAGKDDA